MATLTIMGSGASNGNMVETYMPYATYKSAAVATVKNGSDVGICSNAKTIIWDKSTVSTNDSGWYIFAANEDLWIDLSANPVVVTTKDPNAPPGDHNTLIDGTAYAIDGGNALVDGTVYAIAEGSTLVNGTAHVIAFTVPVTVKISGAGNSMYCHVIINGTKYSSATTLEIEAGTSITVLSSSSSSTGRRNSKVYLNGTLVASGTSSGVSYTFTPDAATVNITFEYKTTSSGSMVTITTS